MLTLKPGPVEVGGVRLKNHLVLAAGVLGTTGASLARQLRNGAGGVVTKSIGPAPMPGHAGPCLVPLEDGLLNAMGLPNPSRAFVEELDAVAGEPVVASIFGGSPEEFAEVGSWFAGRVAGLELNLSCPHAEGYGAALGSDPALVEACTRAVADLGLPGLGQADPERHGHREPSAGPPSGAGPRPSSRSTRSGPCGSRPNSAGPSSATATAGSRGRPSSRSRSGACTSSSRPSASRSSAAAGSRPRTTCSRCSWPARRAVQVGSAVYGDPDVFATIGGALYADDGVDPSEIVGCAHA